MFGAVVETASHFAVDFGSGSAVFVVDDMMGVAIAGPDNTSGFCAGAVSKDQRFSEFPVKSRCLLPTATTVCGPSKRKCWM